ncbi:MAG: GP88 family protein [Candidatus Thorarchaeota archaeon]
MPCRSWSLQALTTCPGSKDTNGELVDACKGCYATTGNYRFPNVKAPREHNQEDWQRDSWVDDMVAELDNDRYFRWFDSGDMYHIKLAHKMLEVMQRTPWVKHLVLSTTCKHYLTSSFACPVIAFWAVSLLVRLLALSYRHQTMLL